MFDEQYTLKYYEDEVKLYPSKCLQPWNCDCANSSGTKCCYSAEEAKQHILKYYRDKLEYLERQELKDFLHDQGIYSD